MQTIRDVAKKAHVSTATVSRVLNNTKPVSPELRQRVAEAVLSIGYRPNAVARSLVTKKSRTIGIIIPDISNPIFGALTKGINAVCQRSGYALMVCESGGECQREFELLDVLSSKNIDGLLFAGVDISEDLVVRMKKENYPVVLVTQEAPGKKELLPTVTHDNIQAVYDAVSFLIDNGHRNIALIAGKKCDYSSGQKRIIGYKKALIDHGIQLVDSYIEYGDFTFDSGYQCIINHHPELEKLEIRATIKRFLRFYSFLIQATCFESVDLHKKYNFLSYLVKEIEVGSGGNDFDIADKITASNFRQKKTGENTHEIESKPEVSLPTPNEVFMDEAVKKKLSEIIDEINAAYNKNFDVDVASKSALQMRDILLKNGHLRDSARNNSLKDFRFAYFDAVQDALIAGYEQNQDFFALLLDNDEKKRELMQVFLEDVYRNLRT